MKTGEALLIVGALGVGAYILTQKQAAGGGTTTILPGPDGGGYPDITFPEITFPDIRFPEWPKFDFPAWPQFELPVVPELPNIEQGISYMVHPGGDGQLPTYEGQAFFDSLGISYEDWLPLQDWYEGVQIGLPSGGGGATLAADWLAGLISTEQFLGFVDAGVLPQVEGGGFKFPDLGGIIPEMPSLSLPEMPSLEWPELPGWPEFPGWPEIDNVGIPEINLPQLPTVPSAGGIGENVGSWFAGGIESLVGGVITGVWEEGAEERAGYAAFAEAATAPSGLTDPETYMPFLRIVDGIEAMANTIAGGGALGGVSPGPGTRETGLQEAAAIQEGIASGELDTWGMPIISAATKPGGSAPDTQGEVWTPTIDPSVPEQWRII